MGTDAHTHQDHQGLWQALLGAWQAPRWPATLSRGLTGPKAGTRGAIDTLWMASAGPWGLPAPKTGTQGGNVSQRESAPRPTPTRISKAGPKGSGSGSQGGNVSQRESAPRPTLGTGSTGSPRGAKLLRVSWGRIWACQRIRPRYGMGTVQNRRIRPCGGKVATPITLTFTYCQVINSYLVCKR